MVHIKIGIPILFTLLCVPFVFGLNGGDDYLYYFENCKKLEVNITGDLQIDEGEYIINAACDLDGEDYWICNCTDDWYFNLTPMPNTINNYSIFFLYDYEEEKDTGGGSKRKRDVVIYPYVENETNQSNQQTNDTISQPPAKDSTPENENRESEVVAPLPQDNGEQKQPSAPGKIQPDTDRNNTQQNDERQRIQAQDGLPWWIIPLGIMLIVFGSIALIIYYVFREEVPKSRDVKTEDQIEEILKDVEQKHNRR